MINQILKYVLVFSFSLSLYSCLEEVEYVPLPGDPSKAKCVLSSISELRNSVVKEKISFQINDSTFRVESYSDSLASGEWDVNYRLDDLNRVIEVRKFLKSDPLYLRFKTEVEYLGDTVRIVRYKRFVDKEPVGEYYRGERQYLNSSGEIIEAYELKYETDTWLRGGDYYVLSWNKGNLIRIENFDNYSNSNKEFELTSTTYYSYDGSKNPYRAMSNIFSFFDVNISKNNPIRKKEVFLNGNEQITTYGYIYNNYGYPQEVEIDGHQGVSSRKFDYLVRDDI